MRIEYLNNDARSAQNGIVERSVNKNMQFLRRTHNLQNSLWTVTLDGILFFFLKEAKHDHYILTICSWFVPTFSPFGYVYLPKRFPSSTACSARVHSTPTRIFLSVALLLLLLYYQQPLSSPPRETITYVLR